VSDPLDEGQVQLVEVVALYRQLYDEETVEVLVLTMHVVEMLGEHLQVHQDDYKDELDQLYYHEMMEAVVVVVVDSIEELEYVDYWSH
jgi:vacuolar-type H+-ATPase subunit F/Vma7